MRISDWSSDVCSSDLKIMRVVKFSGGGQITFAEHQEAGPLKARDAASSDIDPFKYFYSSAGGLQKAKARQVRIDELGRIFNPGPRQPVIINDVPACTPARSAVDRIVNIATDELHLAAYRGFLFDILNLLEQGRGPHAHITPDLRSE